MATPIRRIVDSSPLILLAKVGHLDLLLAGVRQIIVPDAVHSEVGARGTSDPVFQQIQSTSWLSIVPAPPTPSPPGPVLGWGVVSSRFFLFSRLEARATVSVCDELAASEHRLLVSQRKRAWSAGPTGGLRRGVPLASAGQSRTPFPCHPHPGPGLAVRPFRHP